MDLEQPLPNGPEPTSPEQMYVHVLERGSIHARSAAKRSKRYKRLASIMHFSIPLTSLSLAVVIGLNLDASLAIAGVVAVVLTIVTALNSVLDPEQRYLAYSEACIQIHDWEMATRQEWSLATTTRDRFAVVDEANRRMSEIGQAMARLPIPRLRV